MANERALKLMAELNKSFKKPMVHSAAHIPERKRMRSFIPGVDYVATGGIPINGIIELYGPESSGKTRFAQDMIREFQQMDWNSYTQRAITSVDYKEKKQKVVNKKGEEEEIIIYVPTKYHSHLRNVRQKNVVLIDQEKTYDPVWGAYCGVDNKGLIHIVPDTAEQGVQAMETYLLDPDTCLVVYDSIAVARPATEIDKDMEDAVMATHARFWNRASMKIQTALNKNPEDDATLIVINRTYSAVGPVFGNPERLASGSGMKYAKHMSLEFRAGKANEVEIDGRKVDMWRNVTVENKKNKTGRPFKWADFTYMLNDDPALGLKYGFTDIATDTVSLGIRLGVVQKQGNTYSFGRHKQIGKEKFEDYVRTHPDLQEAIAQKIIVAV